VSSRTFVGAAGLVAAILLWPGAGPAGDPPLVLPSSVPPAERARIEKVLAQASVSARAELEPYPLRLDVFSYFLDHPDFATQVTRTLRLARYRVWRDAAGLHLDDGWGVKGLITPLYGDGGLRVMDARGHYEQSFMPNLRGEAVIVLRYATGHDARGRPGLATSVQVFGMLDSKVLSSLAGAIAQDKAALEARRVLKVFSRLTTHLDRRLDEVLAELQRNPEVSRPELDDLRHLLGR
jgi:hypothetical protein